MVKINFDNGLAIDYVFLSQVYILKLLLYSTSSSVS